jgi:hypothetical protein
MRFKSLVILTLLGVLSYAAGFSQSGVEQKIKWQKPVKQEASGLYKPTFLNASYDYERHPLLPKYCNQMQVLGGRRVILTQLQYKAASAREAATVKFLELSAEPKIETFYGKSKKGVQVSYCFYPFVKKNGQILKVTSFTPVLSEEALTVPKANVLAKSNFSNNPLSTGTWHKIAVNKDGLVKITPAFINDQGISASAAAINSLKIVGNGGGILPELLSEPRPAGLEEVALEVNDLNGDGLFNGNDYAIFYAEGPHRWRYNENSGNFESAVNIYREKNYYFLSVNSGASPAPASTANVGAATVQVTTFDDYARVEDENVNLVGTGRQWFGDEFEFTLSYNYDFSFPDLVTTEPAKLLVNAVGRSSTANTSLVTSYLGNTILNNNFSAYGGGNYAPFVTRSAERTTFTPQGSNLTLNLTYNNIANPAGVAWLDRIELQVRRALTFRGGSLIFRDQQSVGAGNVARFNISNAPSNLKVWRVTNGNSPQEVSVTFNNSTASFTADASQLQEYVAFSGSGFPTPEYVEQVENQDLHNLPVPEMIIVAHPNFLSAAQELADFHNEEDNVETTVVTIDQVYNEYSSGGADITAIRDFTKDLYTRSDQGRFKYLLLFGDASYDYKDRINGNNNFVPVWQSNQSFNLGTSYITDDYYGYMDPGENRRNFTGSILDIGIGRIPCETLTQANQYVAKVKNYATGRPTYSDWRNRILLLADDVDLLWERSYFIPFSEDLENLTQQASPSFNVEKIYTDAYRQVSSTGSETYPEASRDMFRKVQQGCLITNFVGHGGEIGLASEKLLTLQHVNDWTNFDALSFFITITCEFTRFDDPKRVSAGEQLLLNPAGGAIALMTTTRVVGVEAGVRLNLAVFDTVLARPNNRAQTLGEIIKAAKNKGSVVSRLDKPKFSLVGDPAVRLAIPTHNVRTTKINGVQPGTAPLDTLKALSKVTLAGIVEDINGQKLSNFNGTLQVSVYDKKTDRETLVNDGVGAPQKFQERNALIYRGKVSVTQGDFDAEFRVPLDIAYRFGFGKISYYTADLEAETDAAGYFDTILVGGFNENAPQDEIGPEIELYMNDRNFVRGGVTGKDPFLFAVLRDSSGINTVGNGVGHDLRATLNNKNDQPYVLNEFYEADLNSFKSGEVRYQFFDLEEGEYTLRLRAFDIYNNPSESTTEFLVADSEELVLRKLLNYPNPFTTYTEFQFEHNRANQPLEVQVQVFTVSGKLVKTINTTVNTSGNRVTGISWNGLDDYGDKIGKGVYVYRVQVRSPLDNTTADKYEKLVILR